jgi:transposase InsO family protein
MAHPQCKTNFTKAVETSGRIHALIAKGKPWHNGFIEPSNQTDKEEVFTQLRFASSQQRKDQLKLWEMEYNHRRPHQGLKKPNPFSGLLPRLSHSRCYKGNNLITQFTLCGSHLRFHLDSVKRL